MKSKTRPADGGFKNQQFEQQLVYSYLSSTKVNLQSLCIMGCSPFNLMNLQLVHSKQNNIIIKLLIVNTKLEAKVDGTLVKSKTQHVDGSRGDAQFEAFRI